MLEEVDRLFKERRLTRFCILLSGEREEDLNSRDVQLGIWLSEEGVRLEIDLGVNSMANWNHVSK